MFTAAKLTRFAFPLMLASGTYLAQKKRTIYAFAYPHTKEIIRGEYENKIRRDSPPEKIFEVFATEKDGDDIFMTHEDFFKSICPFSYSTKEDNNEDDDKDKKDDDKGEDKKEEQKYISEALREFADVDKDGKVSIYEYYLVTQFIQSKISSLLKNINMKNIFRFSIKIKANKLGKQLKLKNILYFQSIKSRLFTIFQGKEHGATRLISTQIIEKSKVKLSTASILDPRKFSVTLEKFNEHIDLLIKNLLQDKESIPSSHILKIRENILKDQYKFQFDMFPQNESGKISGEDFAKSLVSYMEPNICKKYLRYLDKVDFKGEISFDEFYLFQKFLLDNVEEINSKIEEQGFLNRKKLKKLIEEYQKKLGLQVNNNQIDIFIQVLDANQNNRIEAEEFKRLVENRQSYAGGEETSLSKPYEKFKQLGQIWLNKAERIWDIIIE